MQAPKRPESWWKSSREGRSEGYPWLADRRPTGGRRLYVMCLVWSACGASVKRLLPAPGPKRNTEQLQARGILTCISQQFRSHGNLYPNRFSRFPSYKKTQVHLGSAYNSNFAPKTGIQNIGIQICTNRSKRRYPLDAGMRCCRSDTLLGLRPSELPNLRFSFDLFRWGVITELRS